MPITGIDFSIIAIIEAPIQRMRIANIMLDLNPILIFFKINKNAHAITELQNNCPINQKPPKRGSELYLNSKALIIITA